MSNTKKIIQINTVYGTGSTGKIVANLYQLAEKHGFSPRVAYGRGLPSSEYQINGIRIGNKADFYGHVLYNFFLGSSGFASKRVTHRFLSWLDQEKPDLLHLHNLHGFYLHVGLLFEYIKRKKFPVIWTLHDCWAFTGQCAHFDYAGCEKWKTECHHCPIYRSDYPYSLFKDNSQANYNLKRTAFCGVPNMTIVTPSQWLSDQVRHSYLKDYPVKIIPNGIDLDIFRPTVDLNTEADLTVNSVNTPHTLLGVANIWDKYKGLSYLLQLSKDFDPSNGYQIVIVGLSKQQCQRIRRIYGEKIIALPRTSTQAELAEHYRKACIYLNPTLQDTFPTTNLEALACGTPVITFQTGGSPESLTDQCGITVPRGNYDALRTAVLQISQTKANQSAQYSAEVCRMQALNYDANKQFEQYISLYRESFH